MKNITSTLCLIFVFMLSINAQTNKVFFTNKVKVYDTNGKYTIQPNSMTCATILDNKINLTNAKGELKYNFPYNKTNMPQGFRVYIQKEGGANFTFDYNGNKAFLIIDNKIKYEFNIKAEDNKQYETSKCNISGIIRYLYNDHIGYKVDLGAEIYVIKKKQLLFDMPLLNLYEKLAKEKINHLKLKESVKDDYLVSESDIIKFSNFSEVDERRLNEIDSSIFDNYTKVITTKGIITQSILIDSSGKYNITLPYGEYYFVFISKNRKRPTLTEITGRKHIEVISINQPQKFVSYDFDY